MPRYHVAYYLPKSGERMIRAEVLDFPGVQSQGLDISQTRSLVAQAMQDMAITYANEGRELPKPDPAADAPHADYLEIIPLTF